MENFLISMIIAATPLLLAAIGELVTERSGVLNLGVEGMMLMGAVVAFATASATGSSTIGIAAGAGAGLAMGAIDPETLNRFVIYPDNPRTCKYGARLLTNDDAIGLLEQFLGSVRELRAFGDDREDWEERERWILGCIAELWSKRGLYPSLLNVMRFLGADQATDHARHLMAEGKSKEAHKFFFVAVDDNVEVTQYGLLGKPLQKLARQWQLKPDDARTLLRDVLPRLRSNP